jgi:hypothetical protein
MTRHLRPSISLLAIALLFLSACNDHHEKPEPDPLPPPPPAASKLDDALNAAINRATDTLWKLQGDDGGWHSPVYGHFKPGAAETPLVLAVLARLPAEERKRHDVELKKAMAFVLSQQGHTGGLGTKGEWLEVPTYATALGILAFSRLKPDGWQKTLEPWVAYLKSAQNSEDNGCKSGAAPYGGWGPEGRPVAGIPPRADVSSTRYALQALTAAGVAKDDKLWSRAEEFIKRTQALSKDGGFTFSPTNFELNKAGRESADSPVFRSYGSTTADGILIWQLLPGSAESSYAQARQWLTSRGDVEHCVGLQNTELAKIGWKDGLTFYYRAALAEVAQSKGIDGGPVWQKLAEATIKAQLADGTWTNDTTVMKEDDPLIATSFALETLLICRDNLQKH